MASSSAPTTPHGSWSKVSDLILNLNVYMADIADRKLTFVHSVDIRGNTDEILGPGHHLSGEELPFAGSMMRRMLW